MIGKVKFKWIEIASGMYAAEVPGGVVLSESDNAGSSLVFVPMPDDILLEWLEENT